MRYDFFLHKKSKILFEDDHVLVVDKPAGVLSHPNPGDDIGSSVVLKPYRIKDEAFDLGEGVKLFLTHRLDKETSGCLLFAKDTDSSKRIKNSFSNHEIEKEYIALAAGILRSSVKWKDHLVKKNGNVKFDPKKPPNAQTSVKVMQIFDSYKVSLLCLIPETGRTHQLRVQSAKRNLHILGDRQYGNFPKNKDFKKVFNLNRMFLHAKSLEFRHPTSSKTIHIESPLPPDLQEILNELSN